MVGSWERRRGSALGRFYAKWSADLAVNGAVLIAWQAQFSLVPVLLGLLGILGLLLRDPTQRQALVAAVMGQFPDQVVELLVFMEETRQLGGLLGLASIVGLAWGGYWLFETMAQVFNQFHAAPQRPLLGQVRMALTMMVVYAVLMPVSVLASGIPTFLAVLSDRALPFDVPGVAVATVCLVSLGSAMLMALALYRIGTEPAAHARAGVARCRARRRSPSHPGVWRAACPRRGSKTGSRMLPAGVAPVARTPDDGRQPPPRRESRSREGERRMARQMGGEMGSLRRGGRGHRPPAITAPRSRATGGRTAGASVPRPVRWPAAG